MQLNTENGFNQVNTNFIFIPDWVHRSFARADCPSSAFLNINEMRDIVSTDDLAYTVVLNDEMSKLLNDNTGASTIRNHWGSDSIFSHTVEPLVPLANLVAERVFFDCSMRDDKFGEAFLILELSKAVFGVVIRAGHFCGENVNESISKLRIAILEQFSGRESIRQVATRPFFDEFVKNLILST
jgi:hypothetical protein